MRWLLPAVAAVLALAGCRSDTGPHWDSRFADCRHVDVLNAEDGRRLVGIEDIAVDPDAGLAYLSATDRWAEEDAVAADADAIPRGGLYRLDLAELAAAGDRVTVHDLASNLPDDLAAFVDLRPHGIDLWRDASGETALFVVNHSYRRDAAAGSTWTEETGVLRFAVTADGLQLTGRADGADLCRANDVAARDGERLLVTLDQRNCGGFSLDLERLVGAALGRVVELDFATDPPAQRLVADGLLFANGVAVLPGGTIAVAETRRSAVTLLDGTGAGTGTGGGRRSIDMPGGPDNLMAAPDGSLLAALHTRLLVLAAYMHRLAGIELAPTRLVAIDPASGGVTLLVDDPFGRLLSAATVAALAGGDLLAGSAFDAGLLVCRGAAP
ncbi:MAG: hypothetical protein H6843_04520 [Rhodospirillaceae bacterium]|nr:hypothetical protein [Rhodospirillaceae bacterium]